MISRAVLVILAAGLLSAASATTLFQDAYATHLTDEMVWELIMVSSYKTCSNYHHQMATKYSVITEKYLGLYQIEQKQNQVLCMGNEEFEQYGPAKETDLLVVVYDEDLGEDLMHSKKMGGIYTHSGKNKDLSHAIVFCDCPNFYYSDPVWILTHELSHYVLYQKGYGFDVVEELVHQYDEEYDKCREYYAESCRDYVVKLRVDAMAYSFSVMPPYYPAVDVESVPAKELDYSVEKLGKIITRWWVSGKITEGDYANVLGVLSETNQKLADNNYEVMFKDGPIDDSQTWQDVILADGSAENSRELVSNIQEKLKNDEQIYVENNLLGLPEWFKETATWWIEDKVPTDEFVNAIQYLKDSSIVPP